MAKAKSTKIEVVKTVTENGFTLELSQDEATTLFDIVGLNVNGGGRRKHTDDIYEALSAAGVSGSSFNDRVGMVTFKGN